MELMELTKKVEENLSEGYSFWEGFSLPALDEKERKSIIEKVNECYSGEYLTDFATACQSFYLFRKLHEKKHEDSAHSTLLGDYFFSIFSNHLIPIDNTTLIEGFVEFLTRDAVNEVKGKENFSLDTYYDFIRNASLLI